ncbi:MAG: uroporphyrinogen-III synthase [Thiotrichales bacterium]|nr:uroporphyrinogen-III synthase [Thiotrichales bacterium]
MTVQALSGLTLLNTRPEQQAQALTVALQAQGCEVLACPTLTIEWQKLVPPLPDLTDFDWIIFTSVNAVQGWVQQGGLLQMPTKRTQVLAIGRATAQAGEALGWPIRTLSAQQFDSESLLTHPAMQVLTGQKILLVKGEGGRTLLAETLTQRGAQLVLALVYRRQTKAFCHASWDAFQRASHPVLLVSSYDGFRGLIEQVAPKDERFATANSQAWRFIELTLVYSQRLADLLRQQGWQGAIRTVSTQSDAGVIEALQTYCTECRLSS